jgi:hypothetical protein
MHGLGWPERATCNTPTIKSKILHWVAPRPKALLLTASFKNSKTVAQAPQRRLPSPWIHHSVEGSLGRPPCASVCRRRPRAARPRGPSCVAVAGRGWPHQAALLGAGGLGRGSAKKQQQAYWHHAAVLRHRALLAQRGGSFWLLH